MRRHIVLGDWDVKDRITARTEDAARAFEVPDVPAPHVRLDDNPVEVDDVERPPRLQPPHSKEAPHPRT